MRKNITILLAVFLTSFLIAEANEVEANVTVNMEQISQENRTNVMSLESDLEKYINSQTFTDLEWEGPPIPVEISIYLSGGFNNRYDARLFIASKRYLYGQEGQSITLRLIDDKWSFEYARGAIHTYNPLRFDPFISLIDFYLLLIIGYDLDTYGVLDGTNIYEQAKAIVRLGAGQNAQGYETFSNPGEFTRYNLVSELTDPRFEPFRTLTFEYYVDGLDYMSENKDQALQNLADIINDMAVFKDKKMSGPSALLQAFFDAKHNELAQLFEGYDKDPMLFRNLMFLDPSHSQVYIEAQESR